MWFNVFHRLKGENAQIWDSINTYPLIQNIIISYYINILMVPTWKSECFNFLYLSKTSNAMVPWRIACWQWVTGCGVGCCLWCVTSHDLKRSGASWRQDPCRWRRHLGRIGSRWVGTHRGVLAHPEKSGRWGYWWKLGIVNKVVSFFIKVFKHIFPTAFMGTLTHISVSSIVYLFTKAVGTVNHGSVLQVRLTTVGENSALSQIVGLVEQAQSQRAPVQE